MGFFILKVIFSGLLISFASWLSLKKPSLAGFLISLPLISLISVAMSYGEHRNFEKTLIFAKSILIGIPVSLMFFIPFLFSKTIGLNFVSTYFLGIIFLIIGYFLHKYITNLL